MQQTKAPRTAACGRILFDALAAELDVGPRSDPMNQKIQKWSRWLDAIKQQLHDVMRSRVVFNDTFRVIVENPALPRNSLVYHHLRAWYGDHAIMAVRRQLKVDRSAISLLRLLEEIEAHAAIFTRRRWLDSWGDWADRPIARESWHRFVGDDAAALPASLVRSDIDALKRAAEAVERFADKRVAHHDRGKVPDSPTYDQLNESLDLLDRMFCKYYRLVTGKALTSTTPTIAYNWMKAFSVAWLPADQE
ncbi:MAG: hypothetical protein IPJ56_07545 [Gemmatimonadetes bacterium]|nr:hypothetical protein [Gemmatimonadota bacterium]